MPDIDGRLNSSTAMNAEHAAKVAAMLADLPDGAELADMLGVEHEGL